jgi:NPCBM/NEW2 domain
LVDLGPVSYDGYYNIGDAVLNGNDYPSSVILDVTSGKASVAYNLQRHWRSLETSLGLRDDSSQNERCKFQVFADGKLIYSQIFTIGHSQHISLNVAGVFRIEFRTIPVDPSNEVAYGVLGNAHLTK